MLRAQSALRQRYHGIAIGIVVTGTLTTGSTGSITLKSTTTRVRVSMGAGNTNRVTTDALTVTAVTGISLNTRITDLTATTGGSPGDITIDELDNETFPPGTRLFAIPKRAIIHPLRKEGKSSFLSIGLRHSHRCPLLTSF